VIRLTIGYVYPSVMSQYGDRGNVLALAERARRRGIEAEVVPFELGDRVDPRRVDVILVGGGADTQQRLVAEDLVAVKGDGLREAVAGGSGLLAVCAGYQLLGHSYLAADGTELAGVGIFDAHTVHRAAEVGARLDSITAAGRVRAVGNVVVLGQGLELVGFENHGGRTYLHPGAKPLGHVIVGRGNNGADGTEGCVAGEAIGTYLHGPVLPKNPRLADRLLAAGLRRRYGEVALEPLADAAEVAAHDAAVHLVLAERQGGGRRRFLPAHSSQSWPGTDSGPRWREAMSPLATFIRLRPGP
jgi:CobQ-like glutamine amidotransferase family enzyme